MTDFKDRVGLSLWILLFLGILMMNTYATEPGITIIPDHHDYLYHLGEKAKFEVKVIPAEIMRKDQKLEYEFSEDGAVKISTGTLSIKDHILLECAMDKPGFLRLDILLKMEEKQFRSSAAVAYAPELIKPSVSLPVDFTSFWNLAKAELERIPMDVKLEHRPQLSDNEIAIYKISMANIENVRFYGWLAIPGTKGKHGAVVYIPGAGVEPLPPLKDYAKADLVTFFLEIHGMDVETSPGIYAEHRRTDLDGYQFLGMGDPSHYYYRRVLLSVVRAISYLEQREDVDPGRIGVAGSSQGGGLSIIAASIDPRVKAITANVPAFCDHLGHYYGRPSGWPQFWKRFPRDVIEKTASYYDAALAARNVKARALLTVGFIDDICMPTTVYAAYNNLSGEKKMEHYPQMRHELPEELRLHLVNWLSGQLKKSP